MLYLHFFLLDGVCSMYQDFNVFLFIRGQSYSIKTTSLSMSKCLSEGLTQGMENSGWSVLNQSDWCLKDAIYHNTDLQECHYKRWLIS